MRCGRPATAVDPALFGRRRIVDAPQQQAMALGDDLRLFLMTFAAGFAFVALFIA